MRKVRSRMSRYRGDNELGFVGAAVSAIPIAAKGVKKIAGIFKKKKKKKPKVTVMPTTEIVGSVAGAPTAAEKQSAVEAIQEAAAGAPSGSNEDIVRAIVAAIPGPVRDIVLEALNAQSKQGAAQDQAMQQIAGQVDESLKPQITAMLAALQANQLSGQATLEHEQLVSQAKFRDGTTAALQSALARLESIEARLGKSTIIPPGKGKIFGAKNVLEG